MSPPSAERFSNNLIVNGPRSNKGSLPVKGPLYDSPADIKKAQSLRWVFYNKYDPNPFALEFNESIWPINISLADKLSMAKNRKLNFKTTDSGRFRASFFKIVPADELDKVTMGITLKIANADKSMSDISSIGLVSFSNTYIFKIALIISLRYNITNLLQFMKIYLL